MDIANINTINTDTHIYTGNINIINIDTERERREYMDIIITLSKSECKNIVWKTIINCNSIGIVQ